MSEELENNSLKVGDRFDYTGYEEIGRIHTDQGAMLLLHNNSTHYLIADVDGDHEDADMYGVLLAIFRYAPTPDNGTEWNTYYTALTQLMHCAAARNESLKGG